MDWGGLTSMLRLKSLLDLFFSEGQARLEIF